MPGVTVNQHALPWPILAVLLVGYFVLLVVAIQRAQAFKVYSADFPTHSGTVVVGLSLALLTAPLALSLMALGIDFPNGSGDWLTFVAALCGISIVGMGVKRFTDTSYAEAKARGKASGDTGQFPAVTVQGDASITTQQRPAVPPTVTATKPPSMDFRSVSNDRG